MTHEPISLEPCRTCGAPGTTETFEKNPHLSSDTTVWLCSKHRWKGGDCPSELCYLTLDAWQSRTQPTGAEFTQDALAERLKALRLYLNGEAPLNGVWWHEASGKGLYSWRKELVAIKEAENALSTQSDLQAKYERAVSVLRQTETAIQPYAGGKGAVSNAHNAIQKALTEIGETS